MTRNAPNRTEILNSFAGAGKETQDVRYAGDVFQQTSLGDARAIILTPEQGLSTDERWERETAWLFDHVKFPPFGPIIDLGCGIGRVARRLAGDGLSVVGVDQSYTMRMMAEHEVRSDLFTAVSPTVMHQMIIAGMKARGAIAVWALQHIPEYDLAGYVAALYRCLLPGSPFWTMERPERFIPVTVDGEFRWFNDGVSVERMIRQAGFTLQAEQPVPTELCAPGATLRYWYRP